jgi:DNA repair protein RecO (recombination protein O)
MAIISTEAIVLRTVDLRETSRIAFFFTRNRGRVIGVLKGIRKDPRKFGSSLDKFSVNDIVYYEYRNSDIHLVSQCDMKEFFLAIRSDGRKIMAAEYAAELVNKIMPLEERNPAVYVLLLDYFRTLGEVEDVSRLVHMFQIKVLSLSGFRPHIDSCVRCGHAVTGRSRFSTRLGGLVCTGCVARSEDLMHVSPGAIATLLYVEKNAWPTARKLRMPPGIQKELRLILNNFLIFHLGKNIKSARYLQ